MAGVARESGYRSRLLSALTRERRGSDSLQTRDRVVEDVVGSVLESFQDPNGPSKLVMPLRRRYIEKTLSFDRLEGRDKAAVRILGQALAKVSMADCSPKPGCWPCSCLHKVFCRVTSYGYFMRLGSGQ